jgi:hypothetical protein
LNLLAPLSLQNNVLTTTTPFVLANGYNYINVTSALDGIFQFTYHRTGGDISSITVTTTWTNVTINSYGLPGLIAGDVSAPYFFPIANLVQSLTLNIVYLSFTNLTLDYNGVAQYPVVAYQESLPFFPLQVGPNWIHVSDLLDGIYTVVPNKVYDIVRVNFTLNPNITTSGIYPGGHVWYPGSSWQPNSTLVFNSSYNDAWGVVPYITTHCLINMTFRTPKSVFIKNEYDLVTVYTPDSNYNTPGQWLPHAGQDNIFSINSYLDGFYRLHVYRMAPNVRDVQLLVDESVHELDLQGLHDGYIGTNGTGFQPAGTKFVGGVMSYLVTVHYAVSKMSVAVFYDDPLDNIIVHTPTSTLFTVPSTGTVLTSDAHFRLLNLMPTTNLIEIVSDFDGVYQIIVNRLSNNLVTLVLDGTNVYDQPYTYIFVPPFQRDVMIYTVKAPFLAVDCHIRGVWTDLTDVVAWEVDGDGTWRSVASNVRSAYGFPVTTIEGWNQ